MINLTCLIDPLNLLSPASKVTLCHLASEKDKCETLVFLARPALCMIIKCLENSRMVLYMTSIIDSAAIKVFAVVASRKRLSTGFLLFFDGG